MRVVVNLLGGLLAVGWAAVATDYFRGARRGRSLEAEPPYPPEGPPGGAPSVSIVVAACNEEAKLPAAFRSLLAQDYPGPLEIVAVDDRSTDRTPEILDAFAVEGTPGRTTVTVLHVARLPSGWLGKTHALYQGAARATGAWLLFTDADVVFGPSALSRAVACAERERRDHLTAFMGLDLRGFWENTFGLCFSVLFFLRFRPWHVRDPRRREYLGVGGFNMVRRSAYEAIGTHRAIALEVADDMELGHRIKEGGFASEVISARDLVWVRWQEGGLAGLMNGLTKNAYAGLDYSPLVLLRSVVLLLVTVVWPPIGAVTARSRSARLGYSFCSVAVASVAAYQALSGGIPPLFGLMLPFSSLLLIAVIFRSAFRTERDGGIIWRGTFYPLDMLRTHAVPPLPPLAAT
jgi:glycosyltransferase involved in cell wall biosynthesis